MHIPRPHVAWGTWHVYCTCVFTCLESLLYPQAPEFLHEQEDFVAPAVDVDTHLINGHVGKVLHPPRNLKALLSLTNPGAAHAVRCKSASLLVDVFRMHAECLLK